MNLKSIFYPSSIAIIGASTKVGSVGNDVVKNLSTQGYKGKLYPVNPKADEIYGLKCYADIEAVDGNVDLAVFAIPAAFIPAEIEKAAKKGVKGAIVISAGFKEIGKIELENELVAACRKHDIALIGPNCLGVINPEVKMNASFASFMPEAGSVAFISQSGALCTAVLDYAIKLGIGFSKFMSIGNKAMLDEGALFEYLMNDEKTKLIAMYVEDLKNVEKFREMSLKLCKGKTPKPIIVLKSGRTSAGASASASHTGALAGNDTAYEALFRQSGIIRSKTVSEMFTLIQTFLNNPVPKGDRVAIITNAGGPGVLSTDTAVENGLVMAKLDPVTAENMKKELPPAASVSNPIDILGDAKADRYKLAIEKTVADPNVDSVIVILTPQSMTEVEQTANIIIEARRNSDKPIIASFMGEESVLKGISTMNQNGVAAINFPEEALVSLSKLTQYGKFVKSESHEFGSKKVDSGFVKSKIEEAKKNNISAFPEAEAIGILNAYNITTIASQIATNPDEAEKIAKSLNRKFVMKIVSKDILHKSDAKCVFLNLDASQAKDTYKQIIENAKNYKPDAKIDGVLIAEMVDAKRGAEFIIGVKKDPALGHMLMVGLGGIYVEVFKDVAFSLTPIDKTEATRMIKSLKSQAILKGVRGQSKLDEDALIDCIGRVSQLVTDFPEISELDINPTLVLPAGEGVRALDARIIL